ncbi:MAG TPA: ABC transporter permease, partial [Lachnospiraceae bacterium]|nr:ABC transporter permease [Lachnospiraceae bacterium]
MQTIFKSKNFSAYGKAGLIVIFIIIVMGLASVLFFGDAHRVLTGSSLEAPSFEHLLGTDDLGMDIFAQICHGALISLTVGFCSAALAGIGGSILGILAGYAGKWADRLICGLCDIMAVIPQLPLMIVLGAFFGPSIRNIIFVIAILSWVGPARIARSKVLSLRNEKYIAAAKSYGASFFHILTKHLLPGLLPVIMVSTIRIVSHAVIAEAGLTFLGLGDPTSKSWGVILNRAMSVGGIYFTEFWKWWILPPLT